MRCVNSNENPPAHLAHITAEDTSRAMPGTRDGVGYNRDGICPRAVKPPPAPRAAVVSCFARLARLASRAVSGVRRDRIRSVTVQSGDGGSRPGSGSGPGPGSGPGSGSSSGVRPRRRDRHGRGLRGRLVPPGVPLYRSRAQQFDDLVLEAVARLEPRWETELSDVEFAVQEVPDADTIGEDEPVPLARIVHGIAGHQQTRGTRPPDRASCCSGGRCWPGPKTRTSSAS